MARRRGMATSVAEGSACLVECTSSRSLARAFAPLLFVRPWLILVLVLLSVFVLLFCSLYPSTSLSRGLGTDAR